MGPFGIDAQPGSGISIGATAWITARATGSLVAKTQDSFSPISETKTSVAPDVSETSESDLSKEVLTRTGVGV